MKFMTKTLCLFLIGILIFLFSFQKSGQAKEIDSTSPKIINLDYGFTITFLKSTDYESFSTHKYTKIYKDNVLVYEDSTKAFEIKGNYPSVRKIGDKFELLFYVNDIPSIDYLNLIVIDQYKVIKNEFIPNPETSPKDFDSDGKLELVGLMCYVETAAKDNGVVYISYIPILVYEIRNEGIILDSIETQKVNIDAYGKFHGYAISEEFFSTDLRRFENVMKKYR
jgi:hypothetical protein